MLNSTFQLKEVCVDVSGKFNLFLPIDVLGLNVVFGEEMVDMLSSDLLMNCT